MLCFLYDIISTAPSTFVGFFQNLWVFRFSVVDSSICRVFVWYQQDRDHGRLFRIKKAIGRTLSLAVVAEWNDPVVGDDQPVVELSKEWKRKIQIHN